MLDGSEGSQALHLNTAAQCLSIAHSPNTCISQLPLQSQTVHKYFCLTAVIISSQHFIWCPIPFLWSECNSNCICLHCINSTSTFSTFLYFKSRFNCLLQPPAWKRSRRMQQWWPVYYISKINDPFWSDGHVVSQWTGNLWNGNEYVWLLTMDLPDTRLCQDAAG